MEPSYVVKTDLWLNTVVFRGDDLISATLRLARVGSIEALPCVTWSWNSFINYRIASIPYSAMTHSIMTLKEGQNIVGVAFKYQTANFYDYDPGLATNTFVVKVIALSDRLAETARQEQNVAFRVKNWMDCREAKEMERALWPSIIEETSSLAQVTLWENKVVLRNSHLTQALITLSNIEQFSSLPVCEWEWKNNSNYKIKPIQFNQMIQDFMGLRWNGTLVAIVARYTSQNYYESCPLRAFKASVVKVFLISISKLTLYNLVDEQSSVFGVQDYMDCHEANALQSYLKIVRCKT